MAPKGNCGRHLLMPMIIVEVRRPLPHVFTEYLQRFFGVDDEFYLRKLQIYSVNIFSLDLKMILS